MQEETTGPQTAAGGLARLNYDRSGPPFTEIFQSSCEANRKLIAGHAGERLRVIGEIIDLQYTIASNYVWLIESPIRPRLSDVYRVLFSCVHKNLVGLMSAVAMTEVGLYGPPRSLLRHAFEALVIAKYCSLRPTDDTYDRWLDGKQVFISNGILKKLVRPKPDALQEFWGLLSGYTHSSIYALQPDFDVPADVYQVQLNVVFILMLLECNYHILSQHLITASMRYYVARYGSQDEPHRHNLRKRLRALFARARDFMQPGAKQLVRDFTAKWALKA